MEARANIPVGPPVAHPLPSYWHNPKSGVATARRGDWGAPYEVPCDIIIIGSGISGTMIAWNLLKEHPQHNTIMILEAREACSGATGRNGGHTKAASYRSYLQHVEELGKEEALKIARMEYDNIVETHRLAEELGIDCESKLCKTVDIIYDKATFELGKKAIHALRADTTEEEKQPGKMADYTIYDNAYAVRKRFQVDAGNTNPFIEGKEEVVGAFEYMAGRVNAYRFSTGMLMKCLQEGVHIGTNMPVLRIEPSHDGEKFLWNVVTTEYTFSVKAVILATNGYTSFLEPSLQGKIVPLRGQITAQKPGQKSTLPTPLPTTYSFIYKNGYEYMIPRPLPDGGQHIVIGGGLGRLSDKGASEYGTVDDASLNPNISKYLYGSLSGSFGAERWGEANYSESSERVVQEWTGIMGATADGRPFVGKMPVRQNSQFPENYHSAKHLYRGLWISAGFNGHGMVQCLKSAEALAMMIKNDTTGRPHEGPVSTNIPEWFPKSFLINEDRLKRCHFKGRMDLLEKHDSAGSASKLQSGKKILHRLQSHLFPCLDGR
jgi:glycine/D-amino acid oxidase-like deaminating enzyme